MDRQEYVEEYRKVPVCGEYDVVVCGGGPAGSAAAIASARAGARTLLLETAGCLGGVWTAGQLAWVFDFDKAGFTRELREELEKRGAKVGVREDRFTYDIEEMKLLLEEKCLEAGVDVQLHTRVVAALKDEANRLKGVFSESKSGRQVWSAKLFVDATGDGDLGALAGCGFDYGYRSPDEVQPMTFMALVSVPDVQALQPYISFWQGEEPQQWPRFLEEIRRAGLEPSYARPTLFQVRDSLLAIMINHGYGVNALDARQVTQATIRGRAEVQRIVKALDRLGGCWQGIRLVASADQIGVRDGRRIHGLHRVSVDDLTSGARHPDAVARVGFGVDVHSFDSRSNGKEQGLSNMGVRSQPYDIPLRALIARDVQGLLLAGRCISGDYLAHASYRVTGNAVSMGQYAGVAAAAAAELGVLPQELNWEEIRKRLVGVEVG
ncbi:FAD-dependent oxidoreductase [Cohnella fermenti]|nr:FAD-dependent oxidoreductase [Cohnella fermenti]